MMVMLSVVGEVSIDEAGRWLCVVLCYYVICETDNDGDVVGGR